MTQVEEGPTIDGKLDEPVWKRAVPLDQFTQVEPDEGAEPSEQTEVRILYTQDSVFFGIRCYDSQPDRIVARRMRRDQRLSSDDRVRIVLDTFLDRRNAFYFETNPVGARGDALIQGSDFIRDWDGIWYAASSIDEHGWVAEIAIPFKTLSFAPEATEWGFNVERRIRRLNEDVRWASPSQDKRVTNIGTAGSISHIEDIEQGVGLDVKPFAVTRFQYDRGQKDDDLLLDGGLDLFYKPTPGLTLAGTLNTDFAETEVDERRINLTRFPLFFPEKRDFFLQDAGVFNFGGIRRSPRPFFSRRIGLDENREPVDILAGGKLTGRHGRANIGLLTVQMQEGGDLADRNLSVGRVSFNVLEESSVGVIATAGNPESARDNYLGGVDFNFRDSDLIHGKALEGHSWIQGSQTAGEGGDDTTFGLELGYPNDRVRWNIEASQIGDDFNPALGFVRRPGTRRYEGFWRYRWRPDGYLRSIDSGIRGQLVTNLDDETESGLIDFNFLELRNESGDDIELEYELNREVLFRDFDIHNGVVIPRGAYDFNRFGIEFQSSRSRPISISAEVEAGEFFTGDRLDTELGLQWRPSPHLELGVSVEQNDINLPQGDFITRIGAVEADIRFTPDLSWSNLVQYDNVSNQAGLNSRFRWIIEPGKELFVVANQSLHVENARFRALNTELTTKLGWTFRF